VNLDVSVKAFRPIDRQTARRAGACAAGVLFAGKDLQSIDFVQGDVPAISTLSSQPTIDRFELRCIDSRANVRQKANKISAGASGALGRMYSCDSFKDDRTPIGNGPIGSLTRRPGAALIIGEPISPIDKVLWSPMTVSVTRATPVSPFLSPEADTTLEQICKLGVERSFAAGEYLCRQGDLPSAMHCTLSGRVRVFINRPDGSERILAFAGPRTTFGEFGIFDDFPCPTSAVAIKPSRVLVIERGAIIEAGTVVPEIFLEIARRLAQKTRLMSMHIATDGLPVRKRVAMVLIHLLDA
jgi:CRP-like cAMP-binding protein